MSHRDRLIIIGAWLGYIKGNNLPSEISSFRAELAAMVKVYGTKTIGEDKRYGIITGIFDGSVITINKNIESDIFCAVRLMASKRKSCAGSATGTVSRSSGEFHIPDIMSADFLFGSDAIDLAESLNVSLLNISNALTCAPLCINSCSNTFERELLGTDTDIDMLLGGMRGQDNEAFFRLFRRHSANNLLVSEVVCIKRDDNKHLASISDAGDSIFSGICFSVGGIINIIARSKSLGRSVRKIHAMIHLDLDVLDVDGIICLCGIMSSNTDSAREPAAGRVILLRTETKDDGPRRIPKDNMTDFESELYKLLENTPQSEGKDPDKSQMLMSNSLDIQHRISALKFDDSSIFKVKSGGC